MPAKSTDPALLFIALDGFKAVNDCYGHDVGDKLLTAVGERLSAALGEGALTARLGGDEFAAVVHDAGQTVEARAGAARAICSAGRSPPTTRRPSSPDTSRRSREAGQRGARKTGHEAMPGFSAIRARAIPGKV
jgi:GGDEF domain-containing protein